MRHHNQPYRYPVFEEQVPTPEHLAPYEASMTPYLPAVNSLEYHLSAGVEAQKLPGHLGSGEDKHAFLVDSPEGPAVTKFFKQVDMLDSLRGDRIDREESLRLHCDPLIAGKDVDGLEQLIAADPNRGEGGVMVTTYAPGKRMEDVEVSEFEHITDEHIKRLNGTLKAMRERGLNPHNFAGVLFDPETGFHFVDYELIDPEDPRPTVDIDRIDTFLHNALRDHKKIAQHLGRRFEFFEDRKFTSGIDSAESGRRQDIRDEIVRRARELFPDGE